jgi:hypothetical protein
LTVMVSGMAPTPEFVGAVYNGDQSIGFYVVAQDPVFANNLASRIIVEFVIFHPSKIKTIDRSGTRIDGSVVALLDFADQVRPINLLFPLFGKAHDPA